MTNPHPTYSPAPPVNAFGRGLLIACALMVIVCVLLGLGVALATGAAGADVKAEQLRSRCADLWFHGDDMDHPARVADECRANGWTVNTRMVLSPGGERIWTGLPACRTEDSGRCYWNAYRRANGRGHSFVNLGSTDDPRLVYVHRINGRRA